MDLIISSKGELESIIEQVVKREIGQLVVKSPSPKSKSRYSIDEAVSFLAENGFNISKSYLYKKTMDSDVPFFRFGGRKIVFEPQTLLKWAEDRCQSRADKNVCTLNAIAKSAEKHMKSRSVINSNKKR